MSFLNVKIMRKGDPTPLFDDTSNDIIEGTLARVGIIEAGCQSGKAAIGFIVRLPDEQDVFGQLTEQQFDYLVGIFQGARQHWLENPR